MQNIILDCERLAMSPILHDQDLSQVYLYLCAEAGRNKSTTFLMGPQQLASNLNIGPKVAEECMAWLASLGVLSIDGPYVHLPCVAIDGEGWIDQDRVGFERGFESSVA